MDSAVVKWVQILPDSPLVTGSNLGQRTKFNNIYLRHIKPIDTWYIVDTEGRTDTEWLQ